MELANKTYREVDFFLEKAIENPKKRKKAIKDLLEFARLYQITYVQPGRHAGAKLTLQLINKKFSH